MKRFIVLFLLCFCCIVSTEAQAATIYVKTDGTDPAGCTGGSSWATAFATIHKAIDCASSGDEIWVKKGTFALSAQINVNKAVHIYGGFSGSESSKNDRSWRINPTIVDGQDLVRCFYVTDDATIDGFTITRGATNYGGGIWVSSESSPTIANCLFTQSNASAYGGAVYNSTNCNTIFTNCTFYDNRADGGGGGIASNECSPVITNCTFYDNYAPLGGAIRNSNASPTITNCIMYYNYNNEINNSESSAPTITYCNINQDGYAGSNGNIQEKPQFINPGKGDLHLQSTSPCVDAGNNGAASIPSIDMDGDQRVVDGSNNSSAIVDMGADEVVIWFVDGISGSDPGDCSGGHSWGAAYQSMNKAINCANIGNEIWVKAGSYGLGSSVNIGKSVHLYGGFAGTETTRDQRNWKSNKTTIDGQNTVLCFYVTADATISGFTITGGSSNYGGGMYNYQCDPMVDNNTFQENNAQSGAGMFNSGATPFITSCTFLKNSASDDGGGIYNDNSSFSVILNSVFANNEASDNGGAISNDQSSPTITNCTFSGNSADYYGGSIFNYNSSSPQITNCILWADDAGTDGDEIYNLSGCSPSVTYCDVDQTGYAGSNGNIRQDPLLKNITGPEAASWNVHLKPGSPCIDTGYNGAPKIPDTDFEEDPRILDGNRDRMGYVDMGADEYWAGSIVPKLLLLLLN